ncbi:MAG: glycoside hydrolase family 92 protein [Anaerohalosphaeraceae bacterium]|nr:glycoside hydrolase family 92 protein [Anaerohalosphaeraceae bacterium]
MARQSIIYFLLLSIGITNCECTDKTPCESSSRNEWQTFPADWQPEVIGKRLVDNYLARDYWYMRKHGLAYPEGCIAIGAMEFAAKTNNHELVEKIRVRYNRYLTKEDPDIFPKHQHTDTSLSGALVLRLYRYTDDQRFLDYGISEYADKQWEKLQENNLTYLVRWWIDDMYVLTILQAEAYRATKKPIYADRAARLISLYIQKLQQPNGLFHHADDAPFFWGRGNGWAASGIAEALLVTPKNHPERRVIMDGYRKMMKTLLQQQGANGLWRQIIDRSDAWAETSGSAMFAYAMALGVNNGWLKETAYREAVKKAWLGLCTYLDENANLREVCVGMSTRKNVQLYLERPRRAGDLHGNAPFLWLTNALIQRKGLKAFTISDSQDTLSAVPAKEAVDWVDTFICTQGDNGQLYPGPVCPFGLVKLSPDTGIDPNEEPPHCGYYYDKTQIHGFSHLRMGGTGCGGTGGNILIKPGIGSFTNNPEEYKETYDKAAEKAGAGYYKVDFESGITAELTTSPRVGFHKYTFPKSNEAYILVDLSRAYAGMIDASLKIENTNEISGMIKSGNPCYKPFYKVYYSIKFDKNFEAFKTWKDSDTVDDIKNRSGPNIGAWFRFATSENQAIRLKVGISPVSIETAKYERDNEIKGWDFEKTQKTARQTWQDILGKFEVPKGNEELKTIFYTHLYHSFLIPSVASSSLGTYRGAGDEHTIRKTSDIADDFVYYCTWSLWDDFRKYMLISLTAPDISRNIARSLIDCYRTRGHLASTDRGSTYWPTPSVRMEFASAVILDAYQKNLGGFDSEDAYAAIKSNVDEFKVRDIGTYLEKAYQAYLAMKMAKLLDKTEDYQTYHAQALSYKSIWNPSQKDDQGNARGFFTPGANTVDSVEGAGGFEKYCYEGTLWHYRWFMLHDMQGLINLRGSREDLADDLEYFFDRDLYMHLNEPDMHAPFLFNYLGKPYLTQKWARAFTTKVVTQKYHNHGLYERPVVERIYRADPKGYIETMDDDTGAMSSWFVMSALGLFPGTPGDPHYLIGSPIFPEVILHLKDGKTFTIKANNVSEDNFYIQSAKLNGKKFDKPWIEYSTIMAGGILDFEMGPEPNKSWAAAEENAPPSLSEKVN